MIGKKELREKRYLVFYLIGFGSGLNTRRIKDLGGVYLLIFGYGPGENLFI